MEKRYFEKSRWFILAATVAIASVLCVGALRAFAAPRGVPIEVPVERPAGAIYAISWKTTVITENTNSTAYLTQNYAYQDLTCSFDFAGNQNTQVVTVSLQASNDNSDWFQTHAFTAVTTDTTEITGIISRTLSYCRYERVRFKVADTGQVTPTCKSTFFNNWTPPAYVEPLP